MNKTYMYVGAGVFSAFMLGYIFIPRYFYKNEDDKITRLNQELSEQLLNDSEKDTADMKE
jgi:hypothetical protein|tara:strand:- start:288 stop:467 length:180 start_codon:yes stop_codon:yes gene_type:complete